MEYNNFNFDFFAFFVFSRILFDLILVHIPMLKWYIYSMATSCYVHVCRIHADPNSHGGYHCHGSYPRFFLSWFQFSLLYLSKTRLLGHKFYAVKLTLTQKWKFFTKVRLGQVSFVTQDGVLLTCSERFYCHRCFWFRKRFYCLDNKFNWLIKHIY